MYSTTTKTREMSLNGVYLGQVCQWCGVVFNAPRKQKYCKKSERYMVRDNKKRPNND